MGTTSVRRLRGVAALGVAGMLGLTAMAVAPGTPGAGAQTTTPATAPASAADAYSLMVEARVVPVVPVPVTVSVPPVARASQVSPPEQPAANQAQVLNTGPVPADSALVDRVGVMTSSARATTTPQATAISEAADVNLLGAGTAARIRADVVRAQANADCNAAPNATVTFFNLSVNGTPITNTPAPNTVIDLGVAKLILNEQRPAFDGRGIVVNAIHVVSTNTGDPLLRGDIVVSHAMSTVNCPNGAGTTGTDSVVKLIKDVTPTSGVTGTQLTYTAKVTNNATEACLVNHVIDHLPVGFEFVSTAGELGTTATTRARPDTGIDVFVGNGVSIPVGGTKTQTFVVKIGKDVKPGVYFNNLEIFCADLGNFVKGLDAPVEVLAAAQTTTTTSSSSTTTTTEAPAVLGRGSQPAGELAETGPMAVLRILGALALAAGLWLRRRNH